jgi:hypothetical protein
MTWRPWGELAHSVRTGKPAFDHVFGEPTFEYLRRNADAAAILVRVLGVLEEIFCARSLTVDLMSERTGCELVTPRVQGVRHPIR